MITPNLDLAFRRDAFPQLLASVLGCLLLIQAGAHAGGTSQALRPDASSPAGCVLLACVSALEAQDRDALGRLAYAEAGNQGKEGLTAVVYAVLNRLASGRFGPTLAAVIEAPGQFEPVDRAGGHWRNLPALSVSRAETIDKIFDSIQQGHLPDPTNGATFFQNPQIVAARAAAGEVPVALINFNNQTPIAVIRDHAFFNQIRSDESRGETPSPEAHLVYPPGVAPMLRVDRIVAGTPGQPRAVIYRVTSIETKPDTGPIQAMRVGSGVPP